MAMQRTSRDPLLTRLLCRSRCVHYARKRARERVCVCVVCVAFPVQRPRSTPEPEDERQRVLRIPLSPAGRPEFPSDLIFPPDSLVSSRPVTDTPAWLPFLNLPQKTQQQHSRREKQRKERKKKKEKKKRRAAAHSRSTEKSREKNKYTERVPPQLSHQQPLPPPPQPSHTTFTTVPSIIARWTSARFPKDRLLLTVKTGRANVASNR